MSKKTEIASDRRVWSLKRQHGLGNVVCLLPVLEKLTRAGHAVRVITNPAWVKAFSILAPSVSWLEEATGDFIDLDAATESLTPCEHRTDELGCLAGVDGPFSLPGLSVPPSWAEPYQNLRDAVVFAPEGGHPSRQWPWQRAQALRDYLHDQALVVVGTQTEPAIPCDVDLRGRCELEDLLGVLSLAGTVITMDSGVLHLAAALGRPTVALFGGVDPAYRVRPDQKVIILHSDLDCFPCNKNEICGGTYPCIRRPLPQELAAAVRLAQQADRRILVRLPSLVSAAQQGFHADPFTACR